MEVNTVDKIDCMEVNAVNKKEIKKHTHGSVPLIMEMI
jgi:hypothetical protein